MIWNESTGVDLRYREKSFGGCKSFLQKPWLVNGIVEGLLAGIMKKVDSGDCKIMKDMADLAIEASATTLCKKHAILLEKVCYKFLKKSVLKKISENLFCKYKNVSK